MATVYKVEIVSHWINYPEEIIKEKIKKSLSEYNNEIQIEVIRK